MSGALPFTASGPVVGPQRIVCLTEESTEWLYHLGQEHRIAGISGYTVRPARARDEKPRISAFQSAKIDRIIELAPDCVLGFSDLQAEIAMQLVKAGIPVSIFNQRSIDEIHQMLLQVAAMVDCRDAGLRWVEQNRADLAAMAANAAARGKRHPRVYFEEWDEPPISAIRWVSDLITVAGGTDIFPELARESLGKKRIIADPGEIIARNPDIIIGSWCGKKFRPEKVVARPGWDKVNAVRDGQLFEIKSPDILQPGMAALTDGVAQLHRIILDWMDHHG